MIFIENEFRVKNKEKRIVTSETEWPILQNFQEWKTIATDESSSFILDTIHTERKREKDALIEIHMCITHNGKL